MNTPLFEEWETASGEMTQLIPLPTLQKRTESPNPMVTKYGYGPAGRICRDCVHLRGFSQSATWYKCKKREWKSKGGKYPGTTYPGPDHRVRWPACARFEERKEETQ